MSGIVRRIIQTSKAPAAIGPYSQAVLVDHTLYVSGQIGLDPATGNIVTGGVVAEAEQALRNMGEILAAADTSFGNVVKATVLLQNISDFAAVNEIYARNFPKNFPARAAYAVASLPKGALVEIEAVAIVGKLIDSD